MKTFTNLLGPTSFLVGILTVLSPASAMAQDRPASPSPAAAPIPFIVEEHIVKKISDHVYEIPDRNRPGVPNIAIVVGSRAALVVDTGMGQKSGEIVVREVQRLTKTTELYLATTDFRPEHTTGAQAFPPNTVWIIPEAQREDIHESTMKYISAFSSRSPDLASALAEVKLREPSIVFNRDVKLDLGGVTVRLMWFGPARTNGDLIVFVPEDRLLHSGNFLGSMSYPGMPDEIPSVTNWLDILDKMDALRPKIVIPNHGDVRDGTLIAGMRLVLRDLQMRTRDLKAEGKTDEQAGQILTAEFDVKYPEWKGLGAIPAIVRRFYAESQ
jgi:glyoxylase-like metal-dependent hydrolase (beta-lactamase superfamily II)